MGGLTERIQRRTKSKLPSDYSEQTYDSPYAIVRYPHQARLREGVDFLLEHRPERVMDYGAGDGQLIVEALASGLDCEQFVAYEPVDSYVRELTEKLRENGLSDRVEIVTKLEDLGPEKFDCITCLNVMEHMPLPERDSFYETCERLLQPDGEIFIDVPVEIGPTLAVKAVGRRLLKGRPQEYTMLELARASLGAIQFDPSRFDASESATWIQDHKGFDYRLFRREIEHRFEIVGESTTPIKALPPSLGNQEICFRCRLSP